MDWSREHQRWQPLAILFVMALGLRLVGLDSLPYNYDEPQNIRIIAAIDIAEGQLPRYAFQHPPLSVYVLKIGVLLFGESNFGYRFMNALVGACSVLLIYMFASRGFDHRTGLLAAMLLATNRFHIGWSRQINQEVIYLALATLVAALFWRAYQSKRGWVQLAVASSLALLAKELAVLLGPAFLLFLLMREKSRRFLARRELYGVIAACAAVAVLVFFYALDHPGRSETNLYGNLTRLGGLGFSIEPLEFFLGPSRTLDITLSQAWKYPSMFWPTGVLLLAGVLYGSRKWRDDFSLFLLTIFGFYFAFFSFVGRDPGRTPPHSGEFWWADVALIPSIVLTAHMLLDLADRYPALRRVTWIVPLYLVSNAAFYVAITKKGPLLRSLGLSYDDIVAQLPFLL